MEEARVVKRLGGEPSIQRAVLVDEGHVDGVLRLIPRDVDRSSHEENLAVVRQSHRPVVRVLSGRLRNPTRRGKGSVGIRCYPVNVIFAARAANAVNRPVVDGGRVAVDQSRVGIGDIPTRNRAVVRVRRCVENALGAGRRRWGPTNNVNRAVHLDNRHLGAASGIRGRSVVRPAIAVTIVADGKRGSSREVAYCAVSTVDRGKDNGGSGFLGTVHAPNDVKEVIIRPRHNDGLMVVDRIGQGLEEGPRARTVRLARRGAGDDGGGIDGVSWDQVCIRSADYVQVLHPRSILVNLDRMALDGGQSWRGFRNEP